MKKPTELAPPRSWWSLPALALALLGAVAPACAADPGLPVAGGGSGAGPGGGPPPSGGYADAGARPVVPPATPGDTCDRLTVEARPERTNVLIVLDRSGSMYDFEPGGEGVDRWSPSVAAIEAVTAALDDRLAFGLMLFSSDDACGAGAVRLAPALGNAAALRSTLAGDPYSSTDGGTPTAASLEIARAALAGLPGRSVVLLVTDGAPNCNGGLDPRRCRCTSPYGCDWASEDCLDDERAVAAVRGLREAGISTFVVGYDTTAWGDVMDRMAAEGGSGLTSHLRVTDGASLEGALRAIGGSVASCAFELSAAPDDVRYVRVTVDGRMVDHRSIRADGGGWQLEGERTISLLGPECDALRDGAAHAVDVVVECTPVLF